MYVLLTTWGHVAKLNLDFFYKTQANGDSSFMYCKLKHISVTKDKEQLDSRKVITWHNSGQKQAWWLTIIQTPHLIDLLGMGLKLHKANTSPIPWKKTVHSSLLYSHSHYAALKSIWWFCPSPSPLPKVLWDHFLWTAAATPAGTNPATYMRGVAHLRSKANSQGLKFASERNKQHGNTRKKQNLSLSNKQDQANCPNDRPLRSTT